MSRYCVIGAGAAGLSALVQLRQRGLKVDGFEKTDRVGGHWHTDYEALHLISSRDMTQFDDFPMPREYPPFPRRDEVREYIESYARANGLYDVIRFGTEVVSVRPIEGAGPTGSHGWTVTIDTGESMDYDGVLVANGHLWDPKIPEVPGSFAGKQVHSGAYRNTDDIEGRRVLVVGAGNSGCDLAVDAAQHRFDVDIVIREGVHFQPKSFFGRPRQEVDFLAALEPEEVDVMSRMLAKVSLGEWSDYPGMPKPRHPTLAQGRAVVNTLLPYWIQHGRISVVPGIAGFAGSAVEFTDGSVREYDTILWCTGFKPTLPFLDESLVHRSRGVPMRVGAGIVAEGLERLYFVGLTAARGPQIPLYGIQAKLAARMIEITASSPAGSVGVAAHLGGTQPLDDRLDMQRGEWLEQVAATERELDALQLARP